MPITPQQQALYKRLRRQHFAQVGANTHGTFSLRSNIPKAISGTFTKPKPSPHETTKDEWIQRYDDSQIRKPNHTKA
jgi:hypothetical protein